MSLQAKFCAQRHKELSPSDPRSVEQLEAYYLGLQYGSVFAPLVMQIKEEEAASNALMDTRRILGEAMKR